MLLPEFNELDAVIVRLRANVGAAGCHGVLCGMLCGDAQLRVGHWLRAILDEQSQVDDPPISTTAEELGVLQALQEETRGSLAAADMRFTLLLPDDAAPLTERVNALGSWSESFLHGLGLVAPEAGKTLQGDAGEVIKDITEIAQAAVDAETHSEVNELAYSELVEYLRVGVSLIYEELNPARPRAVRRSPPSDDNSAPAR